MRRDWTGLQFGVVALVIVAYAAFLVGVYYLGGLLAAGPPKVTAEIENRLGSPLRCTNGPKPKMWTRADAEAWVHAAELSIATAAHFAGVPALKQAWAMQARAQLKMVEVCWR